MADFDAAFNRMIHHEDSTLSGKVTIDNNGGKVRFGLNSIAHPDLLDKHYYDIDRDRALMFATLQYGLWYWEPIKGPIISDQDSAYQIFDFSVTSGVIPSGKMVQRVLNDMACNPVLVIDGRIGPKTLYCLNKTDATQFVANFKDRRKAFYTALNEPEYLEGWLKRVDS